MNLGLLIPYEAGERHRRVHPRRSLSSATEEMDPVAQ